MVRGAQICRMGPFKIGESRPMKVKFKTKCIKWGIEGNMTVESHTRI